MSHGLWLLDHDRDLAPSSSTDCRRRCPTTRRGPGVVGRRAPARSPRRRPTDSVRRRLTTRRRLSRSTSRPHAAATAAFSSCRADPTRPCSPSPRCRATTLLRLLRLFCCAGTKPGSMRSALSNERLASSKRPWSSSSRPRLYARNAASERVGRCSIALRSAVVERDVEVVEADRARGSSRVKS